MAMLEGRAAQPAGGYDRLIGWLDEGHSLWERAKLSTDDGDVSAALGKALRVLFRVYKESESFEPSMARQLRQAARENFARCALGSFHGIRNRARKVRTGEKLHPAAEDAVQVFARSGATSPLEGYWDLLAASSAGYLRTGRLEAGHVCEVHPAGLVVRVRKRRVFIPIGLVPGYFGSNWSDAVAYEAGGLFARMRDEVMGQSVLFACLGLGTGSEADDLTRKHGCDARGTCRGSKYVAQVFDRLVHPAPLAWDDGPRRNVWTVNSNSFGAMVLPERVQNAVVCSGYTRDVSKSLGLGRLTLLQVWPGVPWQSDIEWLAEKLIPGAVVTAVGVDSVTVGVPEVLRNESAGSISIMGHMLAPYGLRVKTVPGGAQGSSGIFA